MAEHKQFSPDRSDADELDCGNWFICYQCGCEHVPLEGDTAESLGFQCPDCADEDYDTWGDVIVFGEDPK